MHVGCLRRGQSKWQVVQRSSKFFRKPTPMQEFWNTIWFLKKQCCSIHQRYWTAGRMHDWNSNAKERCFIPWSWFHNLSCSCQSSWKKCGSTFSILWMEAYFECCGGPVSVRFCGSKPPVRPQIRHARASQVVVKPYCFQIVDDFASALWAFRLFGVIQGWRLSFSLAQRGTNSLWCPKYHDACNRLGASYMFLL